jgi:hypothetical protein
MMERVLPRLAALTAVVTTTVALALSSCSSGSGSDDPEASGDSTVASGLPDGDALMSYFSALGSRQPADLQKAAAQVAADGSAAQSYALLLAHVAAGAGGSGTSAYSSSKVVEKGGTYEVCDGDGACADYTALSGDGGRLGGFDIDGTSVADSVVDLTGQQPIDVVGLARVQPQYAGRVGDQLLVLVEVDAEQAAVTPEPAQALYIEQETSLTGTGDGTEVAAGETGYALLTFPEASDVALDGQVTMTLDVGGQEQSVGFGLATS